MRLLCQQAPYPPFKRKREGYGPEIGWDSVGHLASLYEANIIQANSVEDLCNWYQDLAVEPPDRVAAFWQLRPDSSFLPEGRKWYDRNKDTPTSGTTTNIIMIIMVRLQFFDIRTTSIILHTCFFLSVNRENTVLRIDNIPNYSSENQKKKKIICFSLRIHFLLL
jgi:hypothetical protein